MIIDRFDFIDNDLKQYTAMANSHDTAIQVAIIDKIGANIVCELGAGTGNWSGVVSKNLQNKNTRFVLVENFSEAVMYKDIGFPQNIQELEQNLSHFDAEFDIINDNLESLNDLSEKVDVVRIDCDGPGDHYADFAEWLLRNGSDRLVIFADDIRPNVRPDRLFMLHELVRRGDLEFLWGGYEEAAWCRPGVLDKAALVKDITEVYNHHFNYIHFAYRRNFFGSPMSYIVTRPKWTIHAPGL